MNNTLSVNKLFDKFVATFATVVNDFASIRKATRKEKNLSKNHGLLAIAIMYTKSKQNV